MKKPASLVIPEQYWNLTRSRLAWSRAEWQRVSGHFFGAGLVFERFPAVRWLLKIDDDTIVNPPKLQTLIHELEQRWDPMRDVIGQGRCVDSPQGTYPQGGSGYFMSRALVAKFLDPETVNVFGRSSCEDWDVGKWWPSLGLNGFVYGNPRFASEHRYWAVPKWLTGSDWSSLRSCPLPEDLKSNTNCAKFVAPARELATFHHVKHADLARFADLLFNAPKELKQFTEGWTAQFCWERNLSMLDAG